MDAMSGKERTMEFMSPSIGNLAAALAQAQQELVPVAKNATNPAFNSRYADLSSCIAACRSILPRHKLSVSQIIEPVEDGKVCVATILMHESGEWLSSRCVLPVSGGRGTNAAQAAGSAITYARRYGFAAIIGLGTDDDDGNAAGAPMRAAARPASPAQDSRQNARGQYYSAQGGKPRPEHAGQESGAGMEAKDAPVRDHSAPLPQPRLSSWQFKALTVRLGQRGMDTREKCLKDLSAVLGRTVLSSRDLSADDFHAYMKDALPPSRPVANAAVQLKAEAEHDGVADAAGAGALPCPSPAAPASAARPM